jgi:hypothetical protein
MYKFINGFNERDKLLYRSELRSENLSEGNIRQKFISRDQIMQEITDLKSKLNNAPIVETKISANQGKPQEALI